MGSGTRWFNAGLRRVKEAQVVFFDPDNGLAGCGKTIL